LNLPREVEGENVICDVMAHGRSLWYRLHLLMSLTFAKAPLIELIAELRWIPQGSTPLQAPPPQHQGLAQQTIFLGGMKQEEFYIRVGGALHKLGFDRSERLMPAGMPFILHQPVYRFRSESEGKSSVIFQVGYGIFSVHAIPPYHSWAKFSPFVVAGMEALLSCRDEADQRQPFTLATLRYIDFFGEEITQGRAVATFMADVFGMATTLPSVLKRIAISDEIRNIFTKVAIPVGFGDLTVSMGDGQFNNKAGILLDNTVSSVRETTPNIDAIMNMFGSAYSVLHDVFLELTKPIYDLMQPVQGGG
jgi:uncharacterized protein (TIGR04255 family)